MILKIVQLSNRIYLMRIYLSILSFLLSINLYSQNFETKLSGIHSEFLQATPVVKYHKYYRVENKSFIETYDYPFILWEIPNIKFVINFLDPTFFGFTNHLW